MSLDATALLKELKAFLHDAGALGLSIQHTALQSEKADASIVTEADIAISELFRKRFHHYLSQPGHVLVDEEVKKAPRDEAVNADYLWIIDPIDGTATYATNGLFWGIIVSVYRKGEPWIAATYIPALRILYWADETQAYETRDAFTPQEASTVLKYTPRTFSRSTQIHIHSAFVNEAFNGFPCIFIDYWSPLHSGMAAAGRVGGSVFKDAVWDFSAGMTLALRAGYKLRRLADGKIFTKLESDMITSDWQMANLMFIGSDEMYESLKSHFNPALTVQAKN